MIFAANHQSHLDGPIILRALPPRWRYRVAPAMAKEFFRAHFYPDGFTPAARLTNSMNYYLASAFFNAFPLPQRETGTRQTLRYIGDLIGHGYSILIFPEGRRTDAGEIKPFHPDALSIKARISSLVGMSRPTSSLRLWRFACPRFHLGWISRTTFRLTRPFSWASATSAPKLPMIFLIIAFDRPFSCSRRSKFLTSGTVKRDSFSAPMRGYDVQAKMLAVLAHRRPFQAVRLCRHDPLLARGLNRDAGTIRGMRSL